MMLFILLLLAWPVWAGESSSASGALRVQVGAAPQLEKDTSKCSLNGEPVPCVGHVYDQRVGSVAVESQGSVIVDRDVLQAMIREAAQQGGKLAVTVQPSPCYQKMREAMQAADKYIQGRDGWAIYRYPDHGCTSWKADDRTQKLWDAAMKECVK